MSATDAGPPTGISYRDELVAVLLGTWMIGGLFVDGWAHSTDRPESFFTPWHAVLYSGFGAAVGWAVLVRRRTRDVPVSAAERLTLVGLGVFAFGGVADLAWHQLLGVEADIEALLSPSHLVLMVGGLLAMTGPARVAWSAPGDRPASLGAFLPPLLSVTLATAIVAFFWMYLSPFTMQAYRRTDPAGSGDFIELVHMRGIAAIVVTTAILVVPALLLAARWRLPFGSLAVLFTVPVFLLSGIEAFETVPLVPAGLVAGLAGDGLLRRGAGLRVVAAALPGVLWLAYFTLFELAFGIGWSVDLWLGAVVMAVLFGFALSLLVVPPGRRPVTAGSR